MKRIVLIAILLISIAAIAAASSLNDPVYQFGQCKLVFGQMNMDGEGSEYGNVMVWCPGGSIELPYAYNPPIITIVINGKTYTFIAWGLWLKELVD